MKPNLLVGMALAGCLAACATAPKDAAQSVYALEGALTAAINLATAYAQEPTCTPAGSKVCSDPATVVRIKAAAPAAAAAVMAAQTVVADPHTSAAARDAAVANAAQAVTALNALVGGH